MITSNINFTSHVEGAMLSCYNGNFTHSLCDALTGEKASSWNPVLFLEQVIMSRAFGALLSVAAAFDLILHTAFIPITFVYAIGESIYKGEADFTLPWQHLQRVREAVFPLLFGSILGVIHPYLGVYIAEPSRKHIAAGILISGTSEIKYNVVCSPMTAIEESLYAVQSFNQDHFHDHEEALLEQALFWEKEFEKTQSIDFFNVNLTSKVMQALVTRIDGSDLSPTVKELLKRPLVLLYPSLMLYDTLINIGSALICIVMLLLKLIGAKVPAYMEAANSLEVQVYNLVRIPLFLISATFGAAIFLISPEAGIKCTHVPLDTMTLLSHKIKMLFIEIKLSMMENGEKMILPAVEYRKGANSGEFSFLPNKVSHMRYILVKKQHGYFTAELVERGSDHGKIKNISLDEMYKTLDATLSKRYQYQLQQDKQVSLDELYPIPCDLNLGSQGHFDNCPITNLFATLQVDQHDRGLKETDFNELCHVVKKDIARKYSYYKYDYYPFGKTEDIIQEVNDSMQKTI